MTGPFEIAETVKYTETEGETVLVDLNRERFYGLDEVGGRIWGLLAEGSTVEQVCTALRAEYQVDAETLRRDVTDLVRQLAANGWLRELPQADRAVR
jgi:hypothetical protein